MEEVAEGRMNDECRQHQAEELPHHPLYLEQQPQTSASFHPKDSKEEECDFIAQPAKALSVQWST